MGLANSNTFLPDISEFFSPLASYVDCIHSRVSAVAGGEEPVAALAPRIQNSLQLQCKARAMRLHYILHLKANDYDLKKYIHMSVTVIQV
jgi:hypothetical protein